MKMFFHDFRFLFKKRTVNPQGIHSHALEKFSSGDGLCMNFEAAPICLFASSISLMKEKFYQ